MSLYLSEAVFSAGVILLTREHAAISGDIFGHRYWENGATGIKWLETNDAANHLRMNRTKKDCSSPKAPSTEVEKTRHAEWGHFSKGRRKRCHTYV